MGKDTYPMLEIYLDKLYHNVCKTVEFCEKNAITIAGVIKGVNGSLEIAKEFANGGCKMLASSRLEQLKKVKSELDGLQTMLIRVPMLSEIFEMIKYVDVSLNSERKVLDEIEKECLNQNINHRVVLMADLGDLREGYFDENELIETALYVERDLSCVYLEGIGVNLGCYGSIKPDTNNLQKLCDIAEVIEKLIGRKLNMISGGATTSLPLLYNNTMPAKINHLRIGEAILLNYDLPNSWNCNTKNLVQDVFVLNAEVIEIKDKPSYPIGEIFLAAFGDTPHYEDIGIRKKALLAIGKQDFGDHTNIIPMDKGVELIGSSSDHLIADVTDYHDLRIGDILKFKVKYASMLYLTGSSTVNKKYIK